MAPSWITMENIFQYPFDKSSPINASAMGKCAVELTGRNSVSPSTIPSTTASKYSFNIPPQPIYSTLLFTMLFNNVSKCRDVLLDLVRQVLRARRPIRGLRLRQDALQQRSGLGLRFVGAFGLTFGLVDLNQRRAPPRRFSKPFRQFGILSPSSAFL